MPINEADQREAGDEFDLYGAREVGTFTFRVGLKDGCTTVDCIRVKRPKGRVSAGIDHDLEMATARAELAEIELKRIRGGIIAANRLRGPSSMLNQDLP